MADYVPSAIVVGGAIVTIGVLASIRVPLLVLVLIAILSMILVVSQHQDLFIAEYRTAKLLNMFSGYAPFIIVGIVILISLFYIFFLRGLSRGPAAAPTFVQNATTSIRQNVVEPVMKNVNQGLSVIGNSISQNRNRNLYAALERAV